MDEDNSERSTPPIFLTFEREEPVNRVAVVTPGSSYLKTLLGLLKVLQMAFSLGFFICLIALGFISQSSGICFGIIAISGLSATGALLASYLFSMDQKHPHFPWLKTELISFSILALCNLPVVVTIASEFINRGGTLLIVGAFFSLGAMFVYGVNAWRKYGEYLKGKPRRMNRTISSISVTYQHLVQQLY